MWGFFYIFIYSYTYISNGVFQKNNYSNHQYLYVIK